MITAGKLRIKDDLKFGQLILGKHPKSPETFAQRKWLMTQLKLYLTAGISEHQDNRNAEENNINYEADGSEMTPSEILVQETQVAQKAAERYANNYNAWNYRIFLLDTFNAQLDFLQLELKTLEKWVSMHVSDHSGFHYRQTLLVRLEKCGVKDFTHLMQNELSLTAELISRYEGHEAVWCHR